MQFPTTVVLRPCNATHGGRGEELNLCRVSWSSNGRLKYVSKQIDSKHLGWSSVIHIRFILSFTIVSMVDSCWLIPKSSHDPQISTASGTELLSSFTESSRAPGETWKASSSLDAETSPAYKRCKAQRISSASMAQIRHGLRRTGRKMG